MSSQPTDPVDRRRIPDRRKSPTSPFDSFRGYHRRGTARRASEAATPYHVDRYPQSLFTLCVLLLSLTLADGFLTLNLLELGCEEVNPFMRYLIDRGWMSFLMGKYVLTALCLPLMLILQNHKIFRTPLRIRCLLPVFVILYIWLLVYQFGLLIHVEAEQRLESEPHWAGIHSNETIRYFSSLGRKR